MRICIVSHPAVLARNQKVYRELERRGHKITLVVPARWTDDHTGDVKPERVAGFAAAVLDYPVLRRGSVPLHLYLRGPLNALRRARPELLYLEEEPYSLAAAQWAAAARLYRVPYGFYSAQNIVKRYPWTFRRLEEFVRKDARGCIAITDEVAATVGRRGKPVDTHIVPLAVDDEFFGFRSSPPLMDSPVVAYVGRLTEEKGVRVLLAAFRALRSLRPATLVMLGSGPLAEVAAKTEGVVLLGPGGHLQVRDVLARSSVLVVPSITTPRWKEQLGRIVIEGALAGTPIIVSDSGSLPVLARQLSLAEVVQEADSQALTSALVRQLDAPASRESLLATRRRAADKYGIAAVATMLESSFAQWLHHDSRSR